MTSDVIANKPRRSNPKYRMGMPDNVLLMVIGLLLAMGLMSVYSASATHAQLETGNSLGLAVKQILAMTIGVGGAFVFANLRPHIYQTVARPVALVVIGLLAYTLVAGKVANGSERWIAIPVFGQFQPSEFAKIAAVLLLADMLAPVKGVAKRFSLNHVINLGMVLVMIGLIFKQPNLSMTMILGSLTLAALIIGRWPLWLFAVGVPPVLYGVYLKVQQTEYQWRRIVGWLNPWADAQDTGYNLVQSYYAIGSGGVVGAGYGQSAQKLFYLPFPYTDFIFSVISEEWGFVGSTMLVAMFAVLAWRGFRIAMRAPELHPCLLAFGITFVITIQAIINMGVTTGLLPVTGVTLPLISYGGTSIMVTLWMLGMLIGVSRLSKTIPMPGNEESTGLVNTASGLTPQPV